MLNDDINQRTGPHTFGNSMNSFGGNKIGGQPPL